MGTGRDNYIQTVTSADGIEYGFTAGSIAGGSNAGERHAKHRGNTDLVCGNRTGRVDICRLGNPTRSGRITAWNSDTAGHTYVHAINDNAGSGL